MRISVTGIGCVSALGPDFPTCMANLFQGQANFRLPTRFGGDEQLPYQVFEVDDRLVTYPEHLGDLGRTAQLAMVAASEALRDGGVDSSTLQGKRVGICVGTTVGSTMNNERLYRGFRAGEHPEMDEMERYFRSNPAEVLAREFGTLGPVVTIANACSSGADAIGIGRMWLQEGLCDCVLAGGSDELSHISYLGFASLLIAAECRCTPFDRDRGGLNLGEGAAMLLLEPEASVERRKCDIAGYATACDAYHVTAPHPQGLGLRSAIEAALGESGVPVDFINAHGTGTIDNDRVEMQVIGDLFGDIPYFSVKGCTGHTLGAAGAIEAALTAGCLSHNRLPKSFGFHTPPDGVRCAPLQETRHQPLRCGLSQSLAFGGNNSVLMLTR